MSVWIDKKYLNIVSPQLQKFKWKGDNIANHRCPFCGDSKKDKHKARGYHFVKKGGMFYKCHNCNIGMSFSAFLKRIDSQLYKQYAMERFKNGENKHSNYEKPDFTAPTPVFNKSSMEPKCLLDHMMDRLDTLPLDNIAVKYVVERQIPVEKYKEMYFIDDTQKLENLSENTRNKFKTNEPRLVLPCYDRGGKLLGLICRALEKSEKQKRYITAKVSADNPLIFGMDTVDWSKKIIVVEGPIDSLFLNNCIAAGGTNLQMMSRYMPQEQCIFVYDYQPRNSELIKIIGKSIDQGYTVAMLSEEDLGGTKDINEAILAGISAKSIEQSIINKAVSGVRAQLVLNNWKKNG